MHAETRQILAFHVGNRTKASGEALMAKLPIDLKKKHFYTDKFSAYFEIIPWKQHSPVGKGSGKQVILKDLTVRSGKDVQD